MLIARADEMIEYFHLRDRPCCTRSGLFVAHILLSRRCSDSVCFLGVFCGVDNVASRLTLDPILECAKQAGERIGGESPSRRKA